MSATEKESVFAKLKEQKKKSQVGQEQEQVQEQRLINTGARPNVTSNKHPLSIRLTDSDDTELVKWLNEVSIHRKKKITPAKLYRALIHMRKDINMKKLVNALKEVG